MKKTKDNNDRVILNSDLRWAAGERAFSFVVERLSVYFYTNHNPQIFALRCLAFFLLRFLSQKLVCSSSSHFSCFPQKTSPFSLSSIIIVIFITIIFIVVVVIVMVIFVCCRCRYQSPCRCFCLCLCICVCLRPVRKLIRRFVRPNVSLSFPPVRPSIRPSARPSV